MNISQQKDVHGGYTMNPASTNINTYRLNTAPCIVIMYLDTYLTSSQLI